MPLLKNPLTYIATRWKAAMHTSVPGADYLALATVDTKGAPSVRTVLVKKIDARGVHFVTQAQGNKVQHFAKRKTVEALLQWPGFALQVRLRGRVIPMPTRDIEHWWRVRTRDAQILYHAGLPQSSPIPSFQFLLDHIATETARWENTKRIPRAKSYIGFIIVPEWIELLHHTPNRIYERIRYARTATTWRPQTLAP